ncbi:MAG: NUDIX domain-containing protein [Bacteroidetes bacterium]|nr:MAG: NUDIX domain-containing protein [Bacteroidota bacterium]
MYEVFIDDRKVIFAQKRGVINGGDQFKEMKDPYVDYLMPQVEIAKPFDQLTIELDDLPNDFETIFSKHDKVDAAGGIVRAEDKSLFIFRNGKWDIPKGKVDEGEEIKETAIREIEEECGISGLEIRSKICETLHTYDYHGIPTIKKTYWFFLTTNKIKKGIPQVEEGITEVSWIADSELEIVRSNTFFTIDHVLSKYQVLKK